MVVGSRNHIFSNVIRSNYRRYASYITNFLLKLIFGFNQNDAFCGFKILTKKTALLLFTILHLQ